MLRFLGYILLGLGLISSVFFSNYSGTTIPMIDLWFVLSFFIMAIGIYLLIKNKSQAQQRQYLANDKLLQIEQLKLNGEKIKITLDNSEVRTRSYQNEINDNDFPTRVEILDGLYDGNRNYKTQEIQQTYIVFYKQYNDKRYKFISQPSSQSDDVVKRYIDDQGGIDLFIDKVNPNNYYFNLNFI